MQDVDFQSWHNLIFQLTGLNIPKEKAYLFGNRLKPLVLKSGLSMEDIFDRVTSNPEGDIAQQVIDLITTHETSFFRDDWPFDMYRALLDQLLTRYRLTLKRHIKILSAGCSTGEEPYSIAMVTSDVLTHHPAFRYQIDAMDIAAPTLERAEKGFYTGLEQTLEPKVLDTFFEREGTGWRVCNQIRKQVIFQQRNILALEDLEQTYDFIFCRNVAIYFDLSVRTDLFQQLAAHLKPHGVLILGASETVNTVKTLCRHQHGKGYFFKRADAT